jgi:hypothetical protein
MEHRLSHSPPPSGTTGVTQVAFQQQVEVLAKETVQSLDEIWTSCGYEQIECHGLRGDILTKIKNLCMQEVEAEQKILDHAKEQVDSQQHKLVSLHNQLGRTPDLDVAENEANYADKLTALEKAILAISEEVDKRQGIITAAFKEVQDIVAVLGEKMPEEDEFNIPLEAPELSDAKLDAYRSYHNKMLTIKEARDIEMKSVASDCYKSIVDLVIETEGYGDNCSAEEEVAFRKIDACIIACATRGECTFGLSKTDIAELTARFQSLYEEKERRREELGKSGADIARLWTLLRISSSEREQFTSCFQMNLSMHTIKAGRAELIRLKEIRAQSLGKVIASIRAEIEALWREIAIDGVEQRREEFGDFYVPVDCLKDDSVEGHEAYCVTLRGRVEEMRPLLAKLARREQIVQERIELEHIMCNSERLKERGPAARQERKREEEMIGRVNKLEKLTKEIVSNVTTWEEHNGPFFYGSSRYLDGIKREEEAYIELRDSLRNSRKKGKDCKPESTYITAPKSAQPKKLLASTLPSAASSSGLGSPSKASLHSTVQIVADHQQENNKPSGQALPPRISNESTGSIETDVTSATLVQDKSRLRAV